MLESIGMSLAYAAIGIIMSAIGYRLFDIIETKINFAEEIKKGNVAAAIVIAGFLLGICFVIGRTVGS